MKTTIEMQRFNMAALIAASLFLSCFHARAAGYKQADKAGASIAEFRDDIVNVKKEVDAAMAALGEIVSQAVVDPRKAFKQFDKSMPRIDSAVGKAKKQAEEMKEKGQEYFNKWEKEIAEVSNADIRKLAEQRKAKLQATFGNIRTVMEPARDQFNAWLAKVKDLHGYLSQDLTIAGIDSAKEPIAKARAEGQAVQQTMDKVIAELNTVVATLTPASVKK